MLLRHTTDEVLERSALTVNPAKTCQPIGAMYAALGIHNCLPHSHGSQGCCSYHRSTLTRHYKEPVMAATSSFTEGTSVFGGQANMLTAVQTIFEVYSPDVIAIHTTCLSETIGDDMVQIVAKAVAEGKVPEGKRIIHCSTPSYQGSHVTGFASMVKAMVTQIANPEAEKNHKVTLIPGWVEPSDMRELKSLAATMGVEVIMYPDTSDVLDAPHTGKHEFYPRGGTKMEDIAASGGSIGCIGLGLSGSSAAVEALEAKCKVPGQPITDDRGRLLDMISDMHQYLSGKRVAIFGDPDQLVSMTEFLNLLDMKPVYIVTGTPTPVTGTKTPQFDVRIKKALGGNLPEAKIRSGAQADMYLLHQWIKQETVDVLIGNTYGKYIARDEDIPFVRYGFPIMDRVGHSYFPSVGYKGAMRLLEKILGVIMDRQDRDALEERFELVM
jgi:nitrogenase molybdenum-iron protein beta chain